MRLPGSSVLISKFVPLSSPVIPDVWLSPETKVFRSASLAIRDPCMNRLGGPTMDPGSSDQVQGWAGMTAMGRTSGSRH